MIRHIMVSLLFPVGISPSPALSAVSTLLSALSVHC